jgi:tetratricopeptide (TPR) repeat protein
MTTWRRYWRANWLIGRGDYAAAGSIYEQLLAIAAADPFATAMLALCYEQQDRKPDALRLAEESVRQGPSNLIALKTVH